MAIAPFYSAKTREQFLRDAKAALDAEEAPNECADETSNDDP